MTRLLALSLLIPTLGWADTCPDLSNTSELGGWKAIYGPVSPGDENRFTGAVYQGSYAGSITCSYINTAAEAPLNMFLITNDVDYDRPTGPNWQDAIIGGHLSCTNDKVENCPFNVH